MRKAFNIAESMRDLKKRAWTFMDLVYCSQKDKSVEALSKAAETIELLENDKEKDAALREISKEPISKVLAFVC